MKKANAISGLLTGILIILSQAVYSQVDLSALEDIVARNTLDISFVKWDRDTISTFSYVVLYDEQSRLDTIILSPMPDSLIPNENSIDRLRMTYQDLPSQGFDLTSTGIFVPVLLIPADSYYKVFLGDKGRLNASNAWKNLFSILDLHIAENYRQYTVPAVITAFPAVR